MSNVKQDYDIFDDFSTYEDYNITIEGSYETEEKAQFCKNINIRSNNKTQIIKLCKQFVTFFKILNQYNGEHGNKHISDKYPEYLNFWLRHQLELQSISEDDKLELYTHLQNNYDKYDEKRKLQNKLNDINVNDFKSMNMLYKLYKNYNGSLSEYKNNCENFFQLFKENYDKCLFRCYAEGDSRLCDVMKKFRTLYDDKKFPRLNNCNKNSCPLLPDLSKYRRIKIIDSEDINIGYQLVQTSSIHRQFDLPKLTIENYKELNELTWLQYNMPFQYDEETRNYYMMNVLYQFFKYCRKNKNNEKLLSFMNEFIEKYYKTNENEYKKIFADCKNNCKSKKYGQPYESCKEKYGDNLLLIENDPHSYLERQKNYIKSLSSFELWIFKAQSMFQDFDAMSRISPTVISTMVAIVVCLFFLYKLTPLSTIFRKEKKRRKIPLFFPERPINDAKNNNSGHMKAKPKRGKIRFSYQLT